MADIWTNLTDALNKQMSIEEMAKKYANTFLILQTQYGKEMVVQYFGYEEGYHKLKDEFGVLLHLQQDTDQQIICKFPERCLFNHNRVAYEFTRLPLRQFKRGICADNTRIYSPVRALFDSKSIKWGFKHIQAALTPEYPKCCTEAIENLNAQTHLSIALSPQFMISQPITSEKNKYWLFFSNKLIGYFEKDTFVIKHKLFKQEVLDNIHLFKPYNIEV